MTGQHPITPPPELVAQWFLGAKAMPVDQWVTDVATQAARWGSDQQLELDAKWLDHNALNEAHLKIAPMGDVFKKAMRPKPPTLKEQALERCNDYIDPDGIIRRALEQLKDD